MEADRGEGGSGTGAPEASDGLAKAGRMKAGSRASAARILTGPRARNAIRREGTRGGMRADTRGKGAMKPAIIPTKAAMHLITREGMSTGKEAMRGDRTRATASITARGATKEAALLTMRGASMKAARSTDEEGRTTDFRCCPRFATGVNFIYLLDRRFK